jgi:type II secretory pathway pseudopilin PulG
VVTILAALDIMGGLIALAAAALVLVAGASLSSGSRGDAPPSVLFFVMAAAYGAIGLVQLVTGIGLLQLKSYGRTLQIVISCIGLLGIPIGTILSVLILIYFFKPGVKLLFSGRAPAEMTPEEVALVEKDSQIGVGLVIAFVLVIVLLAVACVGVIAAIAIPSLLRARVSANEAGALGNVRTMVSAQVAYASANSGLYDKPECLVTPSACIPGYPANAPTFLDASFAAPGPRSGYVYAFHPKPPAGQRPAASSPSSVTGFAYTATPLQQGRTGVRSFCAEESGAICSSTGVGGRALSAQGGACPADCEPLR